jgi:hypothetical protein
MSEIVENRRFFCRSRIVNLPDQKNLSLKIHMPPLRDLCKLDLNLIYRLGGDRFCSFESVLLLTYCTYWCDGKK